MATEKLTSLLKNWVFWVIIVAIFILPVGGILLVSTTSLTSEAAYKTSAGYADSADYASGLSYTNSYYDEYQAIQAEERLKVETASITTEITRGSFDQEQEALKNIVEQNNAYFQSENKNLIGNGKNAYYHGSYTIQVPQENFRSTVESLKQIGKVTYLNTQANDVTATFLNTQDQLETERSKLARYEALLAKATRMQDQIELVEVISNQERTIKGLENSLERQEARINYARIDFRLNEQASDYANIKGIKFSSLVETIAASAKAVLYFIFAIAPWLVLAVFIFYCVKLVKALKRK